MWPFYATPNFICKCDCSGHCCGEVKFSYCIDDIDFDSHVQKKSFWLEKNSSVFSFRRDRYYYYYQAQQQIYPTGRDYLDFAQVALKVKLIFMKTFAMMPSMIISKSKEDVQLAERVRTINVGPVQQQRNAKVYGSSLALINDANVTFHKLMCPDRLDLITCLTSARMEQCPAVIFPQKPCNQNQYQVGTCSFIKNLSAICSVTHEIMPEDKWVNAFGREGAGLYGKIKSCYIQAFFLVVV